MENKFFRNNTFKVVGKLIKADVRTGNRRDNGQGYISVDMTIESMLDGKKNEFEVGLFASQMTKDGKPSQLYTSYSKLPELEGKKIEVTGELRENRYFSTNLNQMISAQQLSGRWVRSVVESTADEGSFEIGGFVVKTLVEKCNKAGEVYRYDLTLGQSNYNGNGMSMFVLHVDPNEREIVSGVEGYNVGDTVRLNGNLRFTVETVTSTSESEGGFGAPVTRTFTNRQKNFFIEGGSAPIEGESAYTSDDAKRFIELYKAHDTELSANAKPAETKTTASADVPVTKRQTSLI